MRHPDILTDIRDGYSDTEWKRKKQYETTLKTPCDTTLKTLCEPVIPNSLQITFRFVRNYGSGPTGIIFR